MQKFGIDTSAWQGDFDFKRAKEKEGVEFAILKIGGGDAGLYSDKQFNNSYWKCKSIDIPVGAYYFGHAMSMNQAESEVKHILKLLEGRMFEYPIFYDVEGDMLKVDKRTLTNIINYVCSSLERAGYGAGIYGSVDNLQYHTYDSELKRYSHWGASWSVKEPPVFKSGSATQMWQFGGSKNSIRSTQINGQTVDQNYCYIDYPSKIKAKGLNGYGKKTYTEYVVKKGDCLWGIATKLLGSGVRYTEIKELNSLTSNLIVPSQVLKIPQK